MNDTGKKVLITGGAGYIGSHTLIELIEAGFVPVVLDNLCNSKAIVLDKVAQITGQTVDFVLGDVLDKALLTELFAKHHFVAVIHFAGLKAVAESVAMPMNYYQNNVMGTLVLLQVMQAFNVKRLVFSSSATVYGNPNHLPIDETMALAPINPYGQTKAMTETILADLADSDKDWRIIALRYFNPIGAHYSGLIGEDPNDIPNNLMPYVSQVAVGNLPMLQIFGDDYDTIDGTGVRDYIHVVDLAQGHIAALMYLNQNNCSFLPINLGTGQGVSVLQLVHTFAQTTGQPINYVITNRRAGDVAKCYASAERAKTMLGWQAKKTLAQMCQDTWRWQQANPNGYQ